MQPKDKFGNPIYDKIYNRLLFNGLILKRWGYVEARKKPNLFFKKVNEGVFFADMRGTEEVPIWEDTQPLFYFMPEKGVQIWLVNRVTANEMRNLEKMGCPCRGSFEESMHAIDKLYEISDELERERTYKYEFCYYLIQNGYCNFCGRDFKANGYFCSEKCEKRFLERENKREEKRNYKHSPKCRVCRKKILKSEDRMEHHISYEPEITIIIHKKCHGKIHKKDSDFPQLKPQKEGRKQFIVRKKEERKILLKKKEEEAFEKRKRLQKPELVNSIFYRHPKQFYCPNCKKNTQHIYYSFWICWECDKRNDTIGSNEK